MSLKKITLALLCFNISVTAMDIVHKKKLYLVAGSTRHNNISEVFPTSQLWKDQNSDLSHSKTYKSRATTIDLEECEVPNSNHIQGDISLYDFDAYVIKKAYLERLPTFYYKVKSGEIFADDKNKNYLGDCIKNIAKSMPKNAKIEIEWHPFLSMVVKNLDTVQSVIEEDLTKKNPFNAFFNAQFACLSLERACNKPFPNIPLSEKCIEYVNQLSATLKELIIFYQKNGVGYKDLLEKRIDEELWLWTSLLEHGELAVLSCGPSASLEKFSRAIETFHTLDKDNLIGQIAAQLKNLQLYGSDRVLTESLFSCLLRDAAIIHGKKYAKEFMKNNDFENISITRTKSPRNGRENVWMITAIKK